MTRRALAHRPLGVAEREALEVPAGQEAPEQEAAQGERAGRARPWLPGQGQMATSAARVRSEGRTQTAAEAGTVSQGESAWVRSRSVTAEQEARAGKEGQGVKGAAAEHTVFTLLLSPGARRRVVTQALEPRALRPHPAITALAAYAPLRPTRMPSPPAVAVEAAGVA
ncbi:MAG: hypothetical protein NTU53_06960, partial [Planctomycetota bacterium]|nr:hypothetical protein [Planctomycetota bacterium]